MQHLPRTLRIDGKQRGALDPQARKVAGAEYALAVGANLGRGGEVEPAQLLLFDANDKLFQDAGTLVIPKLLMQVDRHGAVGDFRQQLRRTFLCHCHG